MGYCERKEKNRLERRGEREPAVRKPKHRECRQKQARAMQTMQTKDAESIYSWAPYGAAHDCRIEKEKKKKKKEALKEIVLLLMLLSPPFLKKS